MESRTKSLINITVFFKLCIIETFSTQNGCCVVNTPLNISKSVKSKLIVLHGRNLFLSFFDSPKCLNYRIFKPDLKLENLHADRTTTYTF